MMRIFHKCTGRTALAVVVLLATQLAFAGQACRAVMVGALWDGLPLQGSFRSNSASLTAQPHGCCNAVPASSAMCVVSPGAVTEAVVSADGARLHDLAVSILDVRVPTDRFIWSFATAPPPTATVGSLLPAYILFGRFLS